MNTVFGDPRAQLPDVADADNPLVWCERCQKHHKKFTFTRADYDRVISQQARQLADAIDQQAIDRFMREQS